MPISSCMQNKQSSHNICIKVKGLTINVVAIVFQKLWGWTE